MVKLHDSFGFIKLYQKILWKDPNILYLVLYVLVLCWQFVDFSAWILM